MKIVASKMPLIKQKYKQQMNSEIQENKIERKMSSNFPLNQQNQKNFVDLETTPNAQERKCLQNEYKNNKILKDRNDLDSQKNHPQEIQNKTNLLGSFKFKASPLQESNPPNSSQSSFNALSILHNPFLSIYEKLHIAQIAITSRKIKERSEDFHYSSRIKDSSNNSLLNRNKRDLFTKEGSRICTTGLESKSKFKQFKYVPIKEYSQNRFKHNEAKNNFSIIISIFESLKNNLKLNEKNQLLIARRFIETNSPYKQLSDASICKFINFILNEYKPNPYQQILEIIQKGLGIDNCESNQSEIKTEYNKEKYIINFKRSKTPGSCTNKKIKLTFQRNPYSFHKKDRTQKNMKDLHNIPLLKCEPNRLSVVLSSYIQNNTLLDLGYRKFIPILDSGENARMKKCQIKNKIGLEKIMYSRSCNNIYVNKKVRQIKLSDGIS